MRFGRRSPRNWGRERRDDENDKRKGKARPKLALVGGIVFAVGVSLVMYGVNIRNLNIMIGGGFVVGIGTLMMLFSLSKRNQIRVAKGMERTAEAFKDSCQCCKCTNCGRNHNHWTHD